VSQQPERRGLRTRRARFALAGLVVLWSLSAGFAATSGLSAAGRPITHSALASAAGPDVAVVHHEQRGATEHGRGHASGPADHVAARPAAARPAGAVIVTFTTPVRMLHAAEAIAARAPPGEPSAA
jgi:hypothetical protein